MEFEGFGGASEEEGVLDTLRGFFFEQPEDDSLGEAQKLKSALHQSTEELSSLVTGLDGGYVAPKPGGDVLRDGLGVLRCVALVILNIASVAWRLIFDFHAGLAYGPQHLCPGPLPDAK